MVEIIPAILTNSVDEFEKTVRLIEPYSKRVHLDIADGIFVPNETIKGYSELEFVSTDLVFDVHLMVKSPLPQLYLWANEKIDRFIVHAESDNIEFTIQELRNMNKGVGLAVNPDTPISQVEQLINTVDFVHFMTINPGFQGRDFLDHVIPKINEFHKRYPRTVLSVDGGINPAIARKVIEAGVSVLVSGSFILKSGNVGKAIDELKKISENIIDT